MRRLGLAVGCAAALALIPLITGCASIPAPEHGRHEAGIQEAFEKALNAENDHHRELWRAEYARRVRAYESQVEASQADRHARAEFWRQLGLAVHSTGMLLVEEKLRDRAGL